MLWTIIGLIVLLEVLRLIAWIIRNFWNWLGGGKELDRLSANKKLDEDIQIQIATARAWRRARGTRNTLYTLRNPRLSREQRRRVNDVVRKLREEFLDVTPIGWWQVIMIFFLCSILGLVLEEIWMLITAGLTQNRAGLVWGPFSPLYGFGAVLLTFNAYFLRRHHANDLQIFLSGAVVGGTLEQITGWGMEHLIHAHSWTYIYLPDHITPYVAWRFLVIWGLLGLIWTRTIMPSLLYGIGIFHSKRQFVFIVLLATYLSLDIWMTIFCFDRKVSREMGIPPANAFEVWIDTHYTDEFIANRFQNLEAN